MLAFNTRKVEWGVNKLSENSMIVILSPAGHGTQNDRNAA